MSPLVEMLTLLNRSWKVRFLMRSKGGLLILGRTGFYGSGRARGMPLRGKVERGAHEGRPYGGRCGEG